MKPSFVKAEQIVLLLGDALVLYASLGLTLFIRYGEITRDSWATHVIPFSLIYIIWLAVFYINDLYSYSLTGLDFVNRGLLAMAVNAGVTVAFFYLVPIFGIAPRTNFILNIILAGALLGFWRLLNEKLIASKKTHRVLFLGEAPEAQELYAHLVKKPQLGYTPTKTISTEKLADWSNELENFIFGHKIDTVIVCANLNQYPALTVKLYKLIGQNINITDVISFYEDVMSRIPLAALDEVWFLENIHEERKKAYEIIKRGVDALGSALGGALLALLLPLAALAIKLDDGGPIFYAQKRLGRGRREFKIYKFRTMRPDAEKNGPQFALKDDARITRVGRFLRKTRLDELPQIWNILKGEMSFIGPRPEREEFMNELEKRYPFYSVRLLVKPGLSGWAQIYYNYAASLEENLRKLQYDFFYVKNRSLLLDLMILLKTLNIIFRFGGR